MKKQRPLRVALFASILVAALGPLACGDHAGSKPGAGSAIPTGSATSTDPTVGREPITTQGSSVALFSDESHVVIADEDHEILFVGMTDLSATEGRIVPMPGPPEQVVALDGVVFVTVRTLPTDAARAVHDTIRGPLATGESSRPLGKTKVVSGVTPPSRVEPTPSPAPSESAGPPHHVPPDAGPSASGAPSASARSSASAAPQAKPPARRGTPPLSIDPSVARQSQGGLLIALRPDRDRGLVEIGRVLLAPDAWGLALTPDKKRAVVTSAWASEVSIVDISDPVAMKLVAHEKVAHEPRGVAISPDGNTAFISHLVGTELTRVDDVGGSPKVSAESLPTALARALPGAPPSASLGYSLVLAPDGKTLYAPRHAIGAQGIGSWWGETTVDALDVPSGKPLQPALASQSPKASVESQQVVMGPDWGGQPGLGPSGGQLVQPRAAVYRRSTRTLLVASEGTDSVVELGTQVPDPAMDVESVFSLGGEYDLFGDYPGRGGAPTGLVLSRDDATLFVWCRSTFDLARVDLTSGAVTWYHVADDGLPTDAGYGRRLFYNAKSGVVSGGLGCAACHPDGREDGYVWRQAVFDHDEARFVGRRELLKLQGGMFGLALGGDPTIFARQTPMLAGRVRADGPYGWHGQAKDLLERLIEGFQLHRAAWDRGGTDRSIGQDVAKIDYLADFIRSGLLPPPTQVHDLDETEKKGKAIYEGTKANCMSCHLGDGGSDRKVVQLPPLQTRSGFDAEPDHGFKVPALTFIAGTAPYFHDGSAASLEDLIRTNGNRMGDTSQLTNDEQSALVAYLRTL